MLFDTTTLNGVWKRTLSSWPDDRGTFIEISRIGEFQPHDLKFKQTSASFSRKSVVRGLHAQRNQWQLVTLLKGTILDFQLDADKQSSTFKSSQVIDMSGDAINQLLLAPGVFHGFKSLTNDTTICYQSSLEYSETEEYGISIQSIFPGVLELGVTIQSQRDKGFVSANDFFLSTDLTCLISDSERVIKNQFMLENM